MPPTTPARTVIVAAVDKAAASDQVFRTATAMAALIAGAELHFVHIVDTSSARPSGTSVADLLRDGRSYVDGVVDRAVAADTGRRIAGHISAGKTVEQVLQIASDLAADLIIVGTNGKSSLQRMVLGSVSQGLMNKAHCAVLVARVNEGYGAFPEIEPPCPACLETQRGTNGAELWCQRHATRHVHGHLHYAGDTTFATGAMFVRST